MGSGGSHLPPSLSALFLFSSPSQAGMGTPVPSCARGSLFMVVLTLFGQGIARRIFGTTRLEQAAAGGGVGRGWHGDPCRGGISRCSSSLPLSVPTGKGFPQTGAAARADGIGIACQMVGPCRDASLPATAAFGGGGCPFSGSFGSAWGTHMDWGGGGCLTGWG